MSNSRSERLAFWFGVWDSVRMQGVERADRELLDTFAVCGGLVAEGSVYRFLAEHRLELFPDGLFADLFTGRGRPSVPGSVIATVLVLQALEGVSDREAVQRLRCDVRWKAAAGLGLADEGFDRTVLVLWRARLRASARPERIFDAVRALAAECGALAGRARRALDSTLLDDAVATEDTVTMICAQIRRVRRVAPETVDTVVLSLLRTPNDDLFRQTSRRTRRRRGGGASPAAWPRSIRSVTPWRPGEPSSPSTRARKPGARSEREVRRMPISSAGCPAEHTVALRPAGGDRGVARFGAHCDSRSHSGATRASYRRHRPMVERSIAWLTRGKARRVPYRGAAANAQWLATRAAAVNLTRLTNLGVTHHDGTFTLRTAH